MRAVRTTLLAVALVLVAASAWAQTDVALFLTGRVGTPFGGGTLWSPKYVGPNGGLGAGNDILLFSAMDYGVEDLFLVKADLTAAQRTALSAQADVLVVPTNLDANVSALAVNRIQTQLEAANLPAEWVTTSLTYRQVLRVVRKIIMFRQRLRGDFGEALFGGGVTLDTRWNQLSAGVQQRLRDAAASFNLDTSSITNNSTMRQILRVVASQLPDAEFGGVAL
jgi:hypothetical protein